MGDDGSAATVTVWLVTLAMVTVPMTSLASHNSLGAEIHVMEADEFDPDTGALTPDIPSGDTDVRDSSPDSDPSDEHPYVKNYHLNLIGQGLPARETPPDQTGERYTDCKPRAAFGTSQKYLDALAQPGSDACYVGYMDQQWEFQMQGYSLSTRGADLLYGVNPKEGDTACNGNGQSLEEQAETRVQALVQGYVTGEDCTGGDHNQYIATKFLAIDSDWVSGQGSDRGGSDNLGIDDLTGTEAGSGLLTLPQLARSYTYIFGQPHPDNPAPSGHDAGAGVFGPSPLAGGSPLADITGACGLGAEQRTDACTLLTPEDIMLYDEHDTNNANDVARVCQYLPQFSPISTGEPASGPCGIFGDRVEDFVDASVSGGLAVDGGPDTFLTTLPGWYEASGIFAIAPVGTLVGTPWTYDGFEEDYLDDEEHITPGPRVYSAINPTVPEADSQIWCSRVGFHGQASTFTGPDGGTFSDHGFYSYQADAIDTDVFVFATRGVETDVRDLTHDPARAVIGPVQTLAEQAQEDVGNAIPDQLLPDNVQAALDEAVDRTDYLEGDEADPHTQAGPNNQDPFQRTIKPGLRCDPLGVMTFADDSTTRTGGVIFDANVLQTTVQLKDPTVLQGGEPARESDTRSGYWQPDAYTFSGTVHAVSDSNEDEDLDDCAEATGNVQPEEDFCPWQGLWDVYTEGCSDSGETCDKLADRFEYNLNASDSWPNPEDGTDADEVEDTTGPFGVGLYFTLRITGPTLIMDEDTGDNVIGAATSPTPEENVARRIVGDANPTAQNCVIGISNGFEAYLPAHIGTDRIGDTTFDGDDKEALCPDTVDVGPQDPEPEAGEVAVFHDAFDDQGGASGGFSSDLQWIKLTPTPEDAREAVGGLADGDELCMNGVWTVDDGEIASDTDPDAQSIGSKARHQHSADGNDYTAAYYQDCDSFDTGLK